jgi:hypothetical protein
MTARAATHILDALKTRGHAGIHNPKNREARPGIVVPRSYCALEMDRMNRTAGNGTTKDSRGVTGGNPRGSTARNEEWGVNNDNGNRGLSPNIVED